MSNGLSNVPELLPARMLNEYTYCPRLFHLEWVQKEWADNAFTLDGSRVHQRVDRPMKRGPKSDGAPETRTSVELSDEKLRLIAKIDLLEQADGTVTPVDYKRSPTPNLPEGAWAPERVQLCAQGLLLRAHGYACDRGMLWFSASKQRVEIPFTEELIAETLRQRDDAFRVAAEPNAPPPLVDSPKCEGCSLSGICLPDEHAFLRDARVQNRLRTIRTRVHDSLPLHVTEPGSVIRKDADEIVVEMRSGDVHRLRLLDISSVQVHGSSKITTPALHAFMRQDIPVSYLSGSGWMLGHTRGPWHKNVELRLAQYRHASEEAASFRLAKRFVLAKIKNSRTMLRGNASGGRSPELDELDKMRTAAERCESKESLLGIEGQAAFVYFRGLAPRLRLAGDETGAFDFRRRNRRPPKDPINALLSLCYSLLSRTWCETVERVGFDPYLGFYHRPRYGRPALALDMMEEFRPLVADSVVLGMVRRKEVTASEFEISDFGCTLKQPGRKKTIAAFERRLDEQITHPVFGYRISYRQALEVQARLLGRYLMGEVDEFPEFTTR